MPEYPMTCGTCGKDVTVFCSITKYSDGEFECPECGGPSEDMDADFSRRAVRPVVEFRPHYSYAIGEYVSTKKEMFDKAARKGVKLNKTW